MGFNLYFAGSQHKDVEEYIQKRQCCRLFSYADSPKFAAAYIENAPDCKLFIDSGAFSVAHNGAVINIDEYIEYINSNPTVEIFAQLDDIPFPVLNTASAKASSEKSWNNYIYMMSKVKEDMRDKVIPVYHFGEPLSHLERMLNTEVNGKIAPYIGVGGRHGVSTGAHNMYFDNLFKVVKRSKNPNVKIHAFGMTVLSLLEKYPFYSADSTSWLMFGVNGTIVTKTCGGVSVSQRRKDVKNSIYNLPKKLVESIEKELSEMDYSLQDVCEDYKKRLMFNVNFFKNWADNYERKDNSNIKRKRLF